MCVVFQEHEFRAGVQGPAGHGFGAQQKARELAGMRVGAQWKSEGRRCSGLWDAPGKVSWATGLG